MPSNTSPEPDRRRWFFGFPRRALFAPTSSCHSKGNADSPVCFRRSSVVVVCAAPISDSWGSFYLQSWPVHTSWSPCHPRVCFQITGRTLLAEWPRFRRPSSGISGRVTAAEDCGFKRRCCSDETDNRAACQTGGTRNETIRCTVELGWLVMAGKNHHRHSFAALVNFWLILSPVDGTTLEQHWPNDTVLSKSISHWARTVLYMWHHFPRGVVPPDTDQYDGRADVKPLTSMSAACTGLSVSTNRKSTGTNAIQAWWECETNCMDVN